MIKWSQTIKITRTTSGEYVHGEYQEGSAQEIEIKANVQPTSTARLQQDPEGRRIIEAIKIYTKEPLTVEADGVEADIVEYNGRKYEVVETLRYEQNLNNRHYKTIAARMNKGEQRERDGRF